MGERDPPASPSFTNQVRACGSAHTANRKRCSFEATTRSAKPSASVRRAAEMDGAGKQGRGGGGCGEVGVGKGEFKNT